MARSKKLACYRRIVRAETSPPRNRRYRPPATARGHVFPWDNLLISIGGVAGIERRAGRKHGRV
jgi:hypothetical protein